MQNQTNTKEKERDSPKRVVEIQNMHFVVLK